MTLKKICLLGATGVGKTSLARRFVHGAFSDRYLTTIGVKIDKRVVETPGGSVTLVIWDLAGEDEFAQLQMRYLRGAAGWLAVADGTRPETIHKAQELCRRATQELGDRPNLLLLNKADLQPQWDARADPSLGVLTSAKTGAGVEAAFQRLAEAVHY